MPLLRDLFTERSNIRNLPRLDHLPITKVRDHGLIDPKATPGPFDTGEARRHRAGDHDTSHLDVAVDDDLLHVVTKVRHRGKRLLPYPLLGVKASAGQTERRVNDRVRMKQLIKGVQIARVTGGQPSKDDCLARIHNGTKLSHQPGRILGKESTAARCWNSRETEAPWSPNGAPVPRPERQRGTPPSGLAFGRKH